MTDTILITGGAGFIGRYVARACLERGHRVRVLDGLIEQVHGNRTQAEGLDPEVEVVVGDIRDEQTVAWREIARTLREDETLTCAVLPIGTGLLVATKRT